jgi:putative NADH-flavin reductase
MKIVVFGANGRVGRAFVEYALDEGHEIRALVRDPNTFPFTRTRGVHVVAGNAHAAVVAEMAMRGGAACVSAIGTAVTDKVTTARADAAAQILHAMQVHGVKRLVMTASADILPFKPGVLRGEHLLAEDERFVFDDHRRAGELLAASDVDWTLACPPYMPSGMRLRQYRCRVDGLPDGGRAISAEDVADFLLETVTSSRYVRERVGIAY